jgi:hypothetical protein
MCYNQVGPLVAAKDCGPMPAHEDIGASWKLFMVNFAYLTLFGVLEML